MAEPDHQVGAPCHHPPEADFVSLFLGSVNAVLAGTDAYDAYREFTWRKEHILHNILEQVQDEPLTLYDAMLLMGALTAPSGSDTAMTPQELERLLADKDVLSNLQQQREIIINWLQVLGTAERSQVDQGIRHQLPPRVSLLEAFKAE
jgi:hypothetical protein